MREISLAFHLTDCCAGWEVVQIEAKQVKVDQFITPQHHGSIKS